VGWWFICGKMSWVAGLAVLRLKAVKSGADI